jgi:hypothetical protein
MQKYSNYYSFKINNYREYQKKVNKHQQELYASILTPIIFLFGLLSLINLEKFKIFIPR